MEALNARRIRIHGRVQGVGYRDAMRREAERLGVDGWVRNTPEGSVEAFLQGAREDVDQLVEWARRGPRFAKVECVEELSSGDIAVSAGFVIRFD